MRDPAKAVTNNLITNNCDGIYTQGDSIIANNIIEFSYLGECSGTVIYSYASVVPNIPIISGNTITNNYRGIEISSSLPVINNNIISCNTDIDLVNWSADIIDATNNRWDNSPPTISTPTCSSGIDICDGGAGVDFSGYSLAPSPCPTPVS